MLYVLLMMLSTNVRCGQSIMFKNQHTMSEQPNNQEFGDECDSALTPEMTKWCYTFAVGNLLTGHQVLVVIKLYVNYTLVCIGSLNFLKVLCEVKRKKK